MNKTTLLSLCLGCLLSLPLRAEVAPTDTIPFELGADNRLYVTVHINGQDDRPLRFLLDTGATDVVPNSNSPRTKGLANFTGSVENSGANSVETDGRRIEQQLPATLRPTLRLQKRQSLSGSERPALHSFL